MYAREIPEVFRAIRVAKLTCRWLRSLHDLGVEKYIADRIVVPDGRRGKRCHYGNTKTVLHVLVLSAASMQVRHRRSMGRRAGPAERSSL